MLVPAKVVVDATRSPSFSTSFGSTHRKTSGVRTPARIRFAKRFAAAGLTFKVDPALASSAALIGTLHRRHERSGVEHVDGLEFAARRGGAEHGGERYSRGDG